MKPPAHGKESGADNLDECSSTASSDGHARQKNAGCHDQEPGSVHQVMFGEFPPIMFKYPDISAVLGVKVV